MSEYIDRQAAIDALGERPMIWTGGDYELGCVNQYDLDRLAIETVPSADVEPRKTAEWVYGEKDGADGWYCSGCGFHIPWYYDYYGLDNINFIRDFHTCPHCDAKMLKYTGMKGEWDETCGL